MLNLSVFIIEEFHQRKLDGNWNLQSEIHCYASSDGEYY